MKKLIFIRHAKSDWSENVDDRNRPLMNKGIQRAKELSSLVKDYINLDQYHWYSSPAKRALSTAHIFHEHYSAPLKIEENLYTFSGSELLSTLNHLVKHQENIVVFGHNPAFTDTVNYLGNYRMDNLSTSGIVAIETEYLNNELQAFGKTTLVLTHNTLMDAQ